MKRTSRLVRPAFAMLATAAAAMLSACSSDSEAQSLTTVTIGPQSYSQRAPATTTTTIPIEEAEPGDVVHEEQEYTVQPNDGLSIIANRYEVPPEELAGYNGWADGVDHPISPGETILIPPGAVYIDEDADDSPSTSEPLAGEGDTAPATSDVAETAPTSDAPTQGTGQEPDASPGTDPDATPGTNNQECVGGTYVIQRSDSTRLAVAERFDVTVDALDEINADTPGYDAFYPGLEILIPDSSDC